MKKEYTTLDVYEDMVLNAGGTLYRVTNLDVYNKHCRLVHPTTPPSENYPLSAILYGLNNNSWVEEKQPNYEIY